MSSSSSSWRAPTTLAIAGAAATGLVAYAIYFDYKRRNDAEFRKKLRKEKKRADKTLAESRSSDATTGASLESSDISPEVLRQALEQIRQEGGPSSAEEREQYFMEQVATGERLAAQGPSFVLPAALAFYRALRMYPAPVELIMIYQRTVPTPIFNVVMEMTNLDVKDKAEGYYNHFPPKTMNVAVEQKTSKDADGSTVVRKVMIADKDFNEGEVIYEEHPLAAVLDFDLLGKDEFCAQCLGPIVTPVAPTFADPLSPSYCSTACEHKAAAQYATLLFSLNNPVSDIALNSQTASASDRQEAQTKFVEHIKTLGKAAPLLVAKFIGRQVSVETAKLVSALPGSEAKTGATGDTTAMEDLPFEVSDSEEGYSLFDHVERLRYLEVVPPENEGKMLAKVLETALPGIEQFCTDERHVMLLGKMMYNSFGVAYGEGRSDKPEPKERPEDMEKTRTPLGTQKQIGSGFYVVSSYLTHSCEPSTKPTFPGNNSRLTLVATRAIKKGEELTVAFVDVEPAVGESATDCRRRRRMELARGWRFACGCDRCARELKVDETVEEVEEVPVKDESKVEDAVKRFEEQ